MFTNAQQSVPYVFREKMRIDSQIKDMLGKEIVSFDDYRHAKDEQFRIRIGCENFIRQQRTMNGGQA